MRVLMALPPNKNAGATVGRPGIHFSEKNNFITVDDRQMQFGDVLKFEAVSDDNPDVAHLMHMAVYIGNGMVFEKPDTGEAPWRIITLHEAEEELRPKVGSFIWSQKGNLVVTALRPSANTQLESAVDAWGVEKKVPELFEELKKIGVPNPETNLLACEDGSMGVCIPYFYRSVPMKLRLHANSRATYEFEDKPTHHVALKNITQYSSAPTKEYIAQMHSRAVVSDSKYSRVNVRKEVAELAPGDFVERIEFEASSPDDYATVNVVTDKTNLGAIHVTTQPRTYRVFVNKKNGVDYKTFFLAWPVTDKVNLKQIKVFVRK